jgi:hypothetical protein
VTLGLLDCTCCGAECCGEQAAASKATNTVAVRAFLSEEREGIMIISDSPLFQVLAKRTPVPT